MLGVDQRKRLAPEFVVGVDAGEPARARVRRQCDERIEEFLQALPAWVAHAASFCFSQARAKRSSRSTVGMETPTTSAISSRLRPSR